MDNEYTSVEIPAELYKQIEEKIQTSNMSSVADFITTLLKENLSSDQAQAETETDSLSSEDEEKVKERLKALGYMD